MGHLVSEMIQNLPENTPSPTPEPTPSPTPSPTPLPFTWTASSGPCVGNGDDLANQNLITSRWEHTSTEHNRLADLLGKDRDEDFGPALGTTFIGSNNQLGSRTRFKAACRRHCEELDNCVGFMMMVPNALLGPYARVDNRVIVPDTPNFDPTRDPAITLFRGHASCTFYSTAVNAECEDVDDGYTFFDMRRSSREGTGGLSWYTYWGGDYSFVEDRGHVSNRLGPNRPNGTSRPGTCVGSWTQHDETGARMFELDMQWSCHLQITGEEEQTNLENTPSLALENIENIFSGAGNTLNSIADQLSPLTDELHPLEFTNTMSGIGQDIGSGISSGLDNISSWFRRRQRTEGRLLDRLQNTAKRAITDVEVPNVNERK